METLSHLSSPFMEIQEEGKVDDPFNFSFDICSPVSQQYSSSSPEEVGGENTEVQATDDTEPFFRMEENRPLIFASRVQHNSENGPDFVSELNFYYDYQNF